jgi:hypothetical protein
MGIGFLIFGALILAFGLFICYAKSEQLKGAETVSGVITGFLEKKQRSKYVIETVYCPVVEYEKNGRKMTAEHYEYFRSLTLRHSQGETVLIYVDPHMPKKFYFIDDCKGADLKGIAVAACGAVILIFGLIALAIA